MGLYKNDESLVEDHTVIFSVFSGCGRLPIGDFEPHTITIPAITGGKIYAFGPYDAFAMDMSRALGFDLPVRAGDDGAYKVKGAFFNMQWHVVNKGTPPDTAINWYPTRCCRRHVLYGCSCMGG
jgi:hypothetical protein